MFRSHSENTLAVNRSITGILMFQVFVNHGLPQLDRTLGMIIFDETYRFR